jgi:hypothetical protein
MRLGGSARVGGCWQQVVVKFYLHRGLERVGEVIYKVGFIQMEDCCWGVSIAVEVSH